MSLISCFTEIHSNLALSRLRTKDPDLISLVVIPNKHSNSATYSHIESVLDKREATLSVLTFLSVLMTTTSQREEGVGKRWGNNAHPCLLLQPFPVHEQKKTNFYIKIDSNIVQRQSQLCYSSLNFVFTNLETKPTFSYPPCLQRVSRFLCK